MTEYLSDEEMASLVEAIQVAEGHTSGEIRIHIDNTTDEITDEPRDNAKVAYAAFQRLGMDKTAERNGVLFHVNFEQRYLTIIGDEAIHREVHQSFWDRLHDEITAEFQRGNYFSALRDAVLVTGKELKKFFPSEENNINELPDEITFS